MWATEDKQDSDWEDDDSMDSAKEVVDVDKVGQNKARKLRTLWPCPCCRCFLPGLIYFAVLAGSAAVGITRGFKTATPSVLSGRVK